MVYDYGYGVDMSRNGAAFREGAERYFIENMASDSIKEQFEEYKKNEWDGDESDELYVAFAEDYHNDESQYDGFAPLIVDAINDNEFGGRWVFLYDDYCIFVRATLPEDDEDRANIVTKEQVRKTLAKYLSSEHVLVEPVTIEWVTLDDGGGC